MGRQALATISSFGTAGEIIFGAGARRILPDKAREIGARRILLVTDQGLRATTWPDQLASELRDAGFSAAIYDHLAGEPSMETLELCRAVVRAASPDLIVALGGGSALDTAKAAACLALNDRSAREFFGRDAIPLPGLPVIAMPTTAGTGSEVTPNAVFADLAAGVKKAMMSRHLMPRVALIDPELTYSVPPPVTAATGMDALVHAIESYISPHATLLTQMHATRAIELIGANLRRAVAAGHDVSAREALAWASLLAGMSFANAGVGPVHALAYPLGGRFHVPHGIANALLLSRVMQFSMPAAPLTFAELAIPLGVAEASSTHEELAQRAVIAMQRLSEDIGIPQRLRDLGIRHEDLDAMAVEAAKIERLLCNSPRVMSLTDVSAVYRDLW